MYVGDWMGRAALYWPERLAVVDAAKGERGRFSYAEMNSRANRLAGWLRDRAGVSKGDRVGLAAYNGVEVLDAFFACGKLGAILVPYSWRAHPRELASLVQQTGPKALIFGEPCVDAVGQLRAECVQATEPLTFVQLAPVETDRH